MDIPHERIRAEQDWSWTRVLLERLPHADDAERAAIGDTLGYLGDPRSAAPLRALVLDRAAPVAVREVASMVLRDELVDEPDDATLRAWWASPDPVLRAHALRSMASVQADLVVAVAGDLAHPLHGDALAGMAFGFERPAHHRLLIDALAHADPAVRSIAASTLVWDEPVAAEAPLIAALADPSPEDTLSYYPTRRVLRSLAGRPVRQVTGPRDPDGLARDFVAAVRQLPEAARPALRRWMAPVEDLLVAAWDEVEPAASPETAASPAVASGDLVDVDGLLAALAVIDGPRAAIRTQARAVLLQPIAPIDRARLVRATVDHVDVDLRCTAAAWCGHWGLAASLCRLLGDRDMLVRKAAAYAFGFLPPDPALAPLLRSHLDRADVTGVHATETLGSYVVHADRQETVSLLTTIARDHAHESMVLAAVASLIELEARDVLAALMPRLSAPPLVTWAVHIALLEAARRFALAAPEAAQLADVDQLDVQVALALLAAAR
jgi:HEAT repeat protein